MFNVTEQRSSGRNASALLTEIDGIAVLTLTIEAKHPCSADQASARVAGKPAIDDADLVVAQGESSWDVRLEITDSNEPSAHASNSPIF